MGEIPSLPVSKKFVIVSFTELGSVRPRRRRVSSIAKSSFGIISRESEAADERFTNPAVTHTDPEPCTRAPEFTVMVCAMGSYTPSAIRRTPEAVVIEKVGRVTIPPVRVRIVGPTTDQVEVVPDAVDPDCVIPLAVHPV